MFSVFNSSTEMQKMVGQSILVAFMINYIALFVSMRKVLNYGNEFIVYLTFSFSAVCTGCNLSIIEMLYLQFILIFFFFFNLFLQCQLVTLVIVTYLSSTVAIRVDWNTNTGPIIPPTSTLPPVPKPPFREPAPVWEDQSHDIPNPNTYT